MAAVLKTANRGDSVRGFESHALRAARSGRPARGRAGPRAGPVISSRVLRPISGCDRAPAEEVRWVAEAPVGSVEVDVAVGAEADGEGLGAADGDVGCAEAAGEFAADGVPAGGAGQEPVEVADRVGAAGESGQRWSGCCGQCGGGGGQAADAAEGGQAGFGQGELLVGAGGQDVGDAAEVGRGRAGAGQQVAAFGVPGAPSGGAVVAGPDGAVAAPGEHGEGAGGAAVDRAGLGGDGAAEGDPAAPAAADADGVPE